MFRIVHHPQDWNVWPRRELADLSSARQYPLPAAHPHARDEALDRAGVLAKRTHVIWATLSYQ
jgi:hypothetical protein